MSGQIREFFIRDTAEVRKMPQRHQPGMERRYSGEGHKTDKVLTLVNNPFSFFSFVLDDSAKEAFAVLVKELPGIFRPAADVVWKDGCGHDLTVRMFQ